MRAKKFLSAAELDRLKARVGEVERATHAELAIVIADASGRYDRSEAIVGGVMAAIALVVTDAISVGQGHEGAPLWLQALGVGTGLLAGTVLATVVPMLKQPLVGEVEKDEEVRRAALAIYAEREVGETTHGAGVLLYLSLFEHRLEVIADGAVRAAAPELEATCAAAVGEALKAGRAAAAIDALLDQVTAQLAGKLPARAAGDNQLDDAIVLC